MWKKSGAIYDGDWREGMRNGFGMYSVKKGDVRVKQYAGGWKNDKRHVSHATVLLLCNWSPDWEVLWIFKKMLARYKT